MNVLFDNTHTHTRFERKNPTKLPLIEIDNHYHDFSGFL